MSILTTSQKLAIIDESKDLSTLSAGALPPVQSEEYYFVSYSHKDYKKVYRDILLLQEAGVSIWYDRGLPPGVDWAEMAREAIDKHACAGVIFYVSAHSVTSGAIAKEMEYVQARGKDFLSINLPDDDGEVMSALELLQKHAGDGLDEKKRELFRTLFHKDVTFVPYGAPIENKVEKLQMLKRPPLFDFVRTQSNTAEIVAINSVDVRHLSIPATVEIDGEELAVSGIADCALANCDSLVSVQLPPSLRHLCTYAFHNCKVLSEINLEHVTYIGDQCFKNCKSLKSVTLNEAVLLQRAPFAFTDLDEINVLTRDGKVENYGNVLTKFLELRITTLGCKNSELPYGTLGIKKWAFAFSGIEALSLPRTLRSIDEYAFSYTEKLRSIIIPEIEELGEAAFLYSKKLEEVIFREGKLKEIRKNAFAGCEALHTVELPTGLERICDYAFDSCVGLAKINLPHGLTEIGQSAFSRAGLTELTIPPNVKTIGDGAFRYCKLKELRIPASVKEIGHFAFSDNPDLERVVFEGECPKLAVQGFLHNPNLKQVVFPGKTVNTALWERLPNVELVCEEAVFVQEQSGKDSKLEQCLAAALQYEQDYRKYVDEKKELVARWREQNLNSEFDVMELTEDEELAMRVALRTELKSVSVSWLQHVVHVGFRKARAILSHLEELGAISTLEEALRVGLLHNERIVRIPLQYEYGER